MILARSFNKGGRFARDLPQWERAWLEKRIVPESIRGRHAKTKSIACLISDAVLLHLQFIVTVLTPETILEQYRYTNGKRLGYLGQSPQYCSHL